MRTSSCHKLTEKKETTGENTKRSVDVNASGRDSEPRSEVDRPRVFTVLFIGQRINCKKKKMRISEKTSFDVFCCYLEHYIL